MLVFALWALRSDDARDAASLPRPSPASSSHPLRRLDADDGALLRGTGEGETGTPPDSRGAGLSLAGTVLDPDGVPRDRAFVVLERAGSDADDSWQAVGRRSSGLSGEFRFGGLEAGRYMLSALAPPGLLAPAEVVDLSASTDGVLLRYRRSVDVTVEVVGEEGEPLFWIAVDAERTPSVGGGTGGVTKQDGLVVLRDLDPLASFRLRVSALDGLHVSRTFDPWTPRNQRVVLHTGLLVRGRVVDERGFPFARAWVEWIAGVESRRTRTGDDGTFAFQRADSVPTLVRPAYGYDVPSGREGVLAIPGGDPVELVLPGLRTLTVEVVDWPAPGPHRLQLTSASGGDTRWIALDERGRGEARLVRGETYSLFGGRWDAPCYVYREVVAPDESHVTLPAQPGEAIEITCEGWPSDHCVGGVGVTNGPAIVAPAREVPEGGVWRTGALPPGRYVVRAHAFRTAEGGGRVLRGPTYVGESEAQPGERVRLVLEPRQPDR